MVRVVEHVTERDGGYYLTGHRVTIGVVIAAYKRGDGPEDIKDDFPTLSLADIYGVISFYLDNQAEMGAHFEQVDRKFREVAARERAERPELYARLDAWRKAHPLPPDVDSAE